MNSILEAIQAAQQRNAMRDQMNARAMPVMPPVQNPMLTFISPSMSDGGGDGYSPMSQDTITPEQQYANAIAINRSPVVGLPVVGMPIGLVNNAFIRSFEAKNPEKASKDPNRMYRSLFEQIMDAITGRSNASPFGVDNIGAFPTRSNFGSYGDAFGGGANADIGGSIDSTDQSPSAGTGDDNGTATA